MNSNFSEETTALMSRARLCAIDLGYNYISTMHLFLADCKNESQQSVRGFVFNTSEAFQHFYESQRVTESAFFDSIIIDSLPITIEMEKTIRVAQKLYGGKIKPYHLFLIASQLPETLFYSILQPKEGLHERLENYYVQKGIVINDKPAKENLWHRVTSKLKLN